MLHRIADLAPFARLGAGARVVRLTPVVTFRRCAGDAEFAARLAQATPLAGFPLAAHGLVLAGGGAMALLMGCGGSRDLDLFPAGPRFAGAGAAAALAAAVRAVGDFLWAAWGGAAAVYRTASCVTFCPPAGAPRAAGPPVQVSMCCYGDPAEVVAAADLGSCGAFWDGAALWLSDAARRAAETGANTVDLARRQGGYEDRLGRHFARGFDVHLPGADGYATPATPGGELREGRIPLAQVPGALPALALGGLVGCRAPGSAELWLVWAASVGAARAARDAHGSQPPPACFGYPRDTTLGNLWAACSGRPRALCAAGAYAPGVDVTALCPEISVDAAVALWRGRGAGACLPPAIAACRSAGDCATVVADLAAAAAAALPFAPLTPWERNRLTPVADADWYGSAFAPRSPSPGAGDPDTGGPAADPDADAVSGDPDTGGPGDPDADAGDPDADTDDHSARH